ncbi:MAG: hypothetical protein C6Y22_07940 [Hapalosiphonaceae cyanobacterium JJU2]|nr:MAG: hypothetical protein C6Y22_07940 [Hapalosiphonaceae cyanobacterium JJU2]
MPTLSTTDWNKLCSIMNGYIYSIALATGCELDLFTWLSKHPGSDQQQIADGLSLSPYATRVLLLSCCAAQLIERDPDTQGYFNSELANHVLVSNSPLSMLPFIQFNQHVQLRGCLHFSTALRESRNAGLDEFPGTGKTLYERLRAYPQTEQLFQEGMGNYTRLSPQMIEIPEFAGVKHLLDVGGGDGTNAIRLCQQYPSLKVTILELPSVCTIGKKNVESLGLSNQIHYVEADMFKDPWLFGCDGLLMSHLVEILAPEKILYLYRKAYEVLPKNGLLFVWTLMANDLETRGLQAAKAAMYLFTVASGEGMPWPAVEHISLLKKAGFDHLIHHEAQEIDHGALVARK